MTLKDKLATLPLEPGCYLMKNKEGKIIYVGKAKKLKNRVNSYFVGAHDTKTTMLVSQIADFDYIMTNSEREALILENNLIKKHRPKYNIKLLDDKSYPFIRINKQGFPLVRVVRDKKHLKNFDYFGPYPDATAAYQSVNLINEIFPTQKCYPLRKKKCLYYHMGQCLAPCDEVIDQATINNLQKNIRNILLGKSDEVIRMLRDKMMDQSSRLEFEQANITKQQIESLQYISNKQNVEATVNKSMDVFNFAYEKGYICGFGLFFRQGKMLKQTMLIEPLEVNVNEAMVSFIYQFYQKNQVPKLVVVPAEVDSELLSETLETKVQTFSRGQKRQLLELAKKNAQQKIYEKFESLSRQDSIKQVALSELSQILNKSIHQVELVDVSHLSGSFSVGACVVFVGGEPDKNQYRKYKLHQQNNDVKSMQEMIYRRYLRVLKQEERLSDVLIVDGGALQVNAVKEVIDSLDINISVVGLVKDDHHNTRGLYLSNDELIELDKQSSLYLHLALMQDEVHRFAINYHRQLRSKSMTRSLLDELEGIGPMRKKKLMNHFGSLKKIKQASIEELSVVLGDALAKSVYQQLQDWEDLS